MASPKKKPAASPPQGPAEPRIETISIDELIPDPANLRAHPERNRKAVAGSVRRFKPWRSVSIDQGNVLYAGNETARAAKAAGYTEVLKVTPKPGQLVAVCREDLTETEKTAYAIADNQTALTAEWVPELPAAIASLELDGFDLDCLGFDKDELESLLNDPENTGDGPDEPEHPDEGKGLAAISQVTLDEPKTKVERGQVFHLGRHVLICADVLRDWPEWVPHLKEGSIFCPYPSPFLPLAESDKAFVLVQPDPYLCAVTVDLFEAAGEYAGGRDDQDGR